MGMFCDYFTADSDEQAAAALDGVDVDQRDVVSANGIDPVVQLGTVEALLTERSYDEVTAGPRSGVLIAHGGDGERIVLSVSDELCAALTQATDERLAHVAVTWSQTEELLGEGDPEQLAEVLGELAALAQRAASAGQRLFCRVSV
jgi:hypothetical protein